MKKTVIETAKRCAIAYNSVRGNFKSNFTGTYFSEQLKNAGFPYASYSFAGLKKVGIVQHLEGGGNRITTGIEEPVHFKRFIPYVEDCRVYHYKVNKNTSDRKKAELPGKPKKVTLDKEEMAIAFLKERGYKVMKPVITSYTEV